MPWHPQDKMMRPARAHPFDCGAKCMLGCRCGAKWNAAEFADDAAAAGGEVRTRAHVREVVIEDGVATGVRGRGKGGEFLVRADTVIVAAGGIGTPVLLRASGLEDAGRGMTMDTTAMVYGRAPLDGMGADPPMTWSCPDDDLGVMYSTLIDPWLMYPIIMTAKGPSWAMTWPRWGQTLGVMIKLTDEVSGGIDARGRIDKGLTPADADRLRQAEATAKKLLREAGCDPATIFTTPLRGTHPSSTVRIGGMLDTDLCTSIANLYVCDASVFPRALGRPTVLTISALAKRLARHLRTGRTTPPADRAGPPSEARSKPTTPPSGGSASASRSAL
jgi:choline dehydrogenase-like flavoprotein